MVKHIATGKAELFLDDLDQRSTEKLEEEADAFAREHLIPEREWQRFWEAGDFTTENVRRAAKRLGIHGAILAGRVRKEKNDYQILAALFTRRRFVRICWTRKGTGEFTSSSRTQRLFRRVKSVKNVQAEVPSRGVSLDLRESRQSDSNR